MSDDEILLQLIANFVGCSHLELSDDLSPYKDLGIAGDDGFELLAEIAKEFEIDMRQVDPALYFGTEGFPLVPALFFWSRGRKLDHDIRPLTIANLRETVSKGHWFETVNS